MDALLTRTTVVTSDPAERVIGDGAVAVQGDRIVAVGASSDLEDRYPDLSKAGPFSAGGYPRPD